MQAVSGFYIDAANVNHGFRRFPHSRIITFNVSGAGKNAGQRTFALTNNAAGTITGYYSDGRNVYHGFLGTP